MSSQHLPDANSGLVIDTRSVGRRAGAMTEVTRTVPAPEGIGIDVIAVPPEALMTLDVRVESVVEGELVSGVVTVPLVGQCARCLEPVTDEVTVDVQELYLHPGHGEDDEDAYRVVNDVIDLEPLVRDEVVLDLPFTPLCRPDCAGLCPTCGANMNADLDHNHGEVIDPRWEQLATWRDAPDN